MKYEHYEYKGYAFIEDIETIGDETNIELKPLKNDGLYEAEPQPVPVKGFWRRQFNGPMTGGQRKFDWTFGVVMPLVCFLFDPIVFNKGIESHGFLETYSSPAHVLCFSMVMATMARLLWGERLGWANAFLSGLFAVCSLAALAIGTAVLPLSLIGLIFLVGALGFTPFFTSFMGFRHAIRSYREAKPLLEQGVRVNSFALGLMTAAAIPYLIYIWGR